jgi:hypothetical protein
MAEPVWYRNYETQSGTGMLRYQTEIKNAGIPYAGSIHLDADAQLCAYCTYSIPLAISTPSKKEASR